MSVPLIDDERSDLAASRGVESPAPPVADPLLVVAGVCKRWRGHDAPTLDRLDLEMHPGDVVSIMGRNGVGKTTFLRILGGVLAPDRGIVELDGVRLGTYRRAYQRRIGLLTPGDRGLYARLTVLRHLDLWARLALLDTETRTAAISACSDRFELDEIADVRVDHLSMGQRQRVRLALAFLHAPRLVLLDEPASSLDSAALELLGRAVDEVARRGSICLAVAPEGAATGLRADRVLTLRDGRLEAR